MLKSLTLRTNQGTLCNWTISRLLEQLMLVMTVLGVSAHAADGDFVWAGFIDGVFIRDFTIDADDNKYVIGNFAGQIDADPGPGVALLHGPHDTNLTFLVKLDSAENFVWGKVLQATDALHGESVATDSEGNVYVAGYFLGNSDFDPNTSSPQLYVSMGNFDAFLAKYTPNGELVWVRHIGSVTREAIWQVEVTSTGDIYLGGDFEGTTDFDPGADTYFLNADGLRIRFFVKLDAQGNFLWANTLPLPGRGEFSLDSAGNLYITSSFSHERDFDSGPGTLILTAEGPGDGVLCKLGVEGELLWAMHLGGY